MMVMMMNLCLRAVSVCALDDDGDDNSQNDGCYLKQK